MPFKGIEAVAIVIITHTNESSRQESLVFNSSFASIMLFDVHRWLRADSRENRIHIPRIYSSLKIFNV